MSIESVMPSNHLILCCPLFILPSIFPSIRIFSNESSLCIRQPNYWSFIFSINPSNEYSGLISFRINWLMSLLSNRLSRVFSSTTVRKHQILQLSAFFMAQISHLYITAGKIIALTIQTFVCKMMSLLFNMLSDLSQLFFQRASVF